MVPIMKNAYIEDSILVGRPIGGGTDEMTQDRPWGVNAHVDWSLRIEGYGG
jgi:hypothetical protein